MEFPRVLAALTNDVAARLALNPRRVYLAGMSGGARTALGVALASKEIAGVIASSAGYPDSNIRKTLSFPLFATAGTEDFNHLEMRKLDRALTTPHRLAIFDGGHVWLSSELALQAVEWMQLHAMKAELEPRDDAEIDRMLAARVAAAGTGSDKDTFRALQAIADDFQGLRDVSAFARRAAELGRDKTVRAALDAERDQDRREEAVLREIDVLAARLGRMIGPRRSTSFARNGWRCQRRRRTRLTRWSGNSPGACSQRWLPTAPRTRTTRRSSRSTAWDVVVLSDASCTLNKVLPCA